MSEQILTPVGRMVQGDLFKSNTKNMDGKPLTDKQGNPRQEFFMALAVQKTDPGVQTLIQAIENVAATNPHRQNSKFSLKYSDGDLSPDKEGFAGCYVFRLVTGFAPTVTTDRGSTPIIDPMQARKGSYYWCQITITNNTNSLNPGVFLNLNCVDKVQDGPEIISGPDTAAIFGAGPAPQAPFGAPAPQAPVGVPAPQAPVGAPAPQAPPTPPPPADPGYLNPPRMTAKATAPYEEYIKLGWTDETLRANGYIE